MFITAQSWGIQPTEFWEMTMPEWMTLAYHYWTVSEAGLKHQKMAALKADAALTAEEWDEKHGFA